MTRSLITLAPFSLALIAASPNALADESAALADLSARLRRIEAKLAGDEPVAVDPAELNALTQRLAILERRLEIAQEDAAAKAPLTPAVAVNDKGLSIKSAPPGDFEIRLRGGLQFDQRYLDDDDAAPINDTALFRRIRPSLEGTFGPLVAFRIVPELAEDTTSLIDATIDLKFSPAYSLRVGRMKGPIGLERLASWNALAMTERGFPTELAPNREVGAQLFGELAQGTVNYAIGVFNGTADGRNGSASDPDNHVELEGRLFFEPWKNAANAWSGLGFGIAGSVGDKEGLGNAFLPRYRTPGQNVFFNYRNTVAADGEHQRWSPHAWFYRNGLGLQAEYIRSRQTVALPSLVDSQLALDHDAWQLTGSWVLTGEAAGYKGLARVDAPFSVGAPGWGAFELVGRYGELDIDDRAFPRYADPAISASAARSWGLGLNWYLTSNLKLVFNHTNAHFDGGAANGHDRPDERSFISRVQVAF